MGSAYLNRKLNRTSQESEHGLLLLAPCWLCPKRLRPPVRSSETFARHRKAARSPSIRSVDNANQEERAGPSSPRLDRPARIVNTENDSITAALRVAAHIRRIRQVEPSPHRTVAPKNGRITVQIEGSAVRIDVGRHLRGDGLSGAGDRVPISDGIARVVAHNAVVVVVSHKISFAC